MLYIEKVSDQSEIIVCEGNHTCITLSSQLQKVVEDQNDTKQKFSLEYIDRHK